MHSGLQYVSVRKSPKHPSPQDDIFFLFWGTPNVILTYLLALFLPLDIYSKFLTWLSFIVYLLSLFLYPLGGWGNLQYTSMVRPVFSGGGAGTGAWLKSCTRMYLYCTWFWFFVMNPPPPPSEKDWHSTFRSDNRDQWSDVLAAMPSRLNRLDSSRWKNRLGLVELFFTEKITCQRFQNAKAMRIWCTPLPIDLGEKLKKCLPTHMYIYP
jgi:hypothetical protein